MIRSLALLVRSTPSLRQLACNRIAPFRRSAMTVVAADPLDLDRPAKKRKMDKEQLDASMTAAEVQPSVPDEKVMEMVEETMNQPIEKEKSYEYELNYRNKLVLAPMVRSGTLPARLLSLYYGAGLVWSPEIVDRAIIGAERTVDERTGVITYSKGQGAIFTTHPIEKPYLVYQIGSSNPELALEAAKTVQQDVSGIDLNCGCPKPFSTHAGMGAALLSTPETLLSILRILIENIPLPVSCKIRLLSTQPQTLHLVSRLLKTGIRNLTVHCRTRSMRSSEKAIWDRLGDVVQLGKRRGVPVICNGDGEGWSNWNEIQKCTGADSLMIARAAEKNPSVFSQSGPECNVTEVLPRLLQLADHLGNGWANTKFLAMQYHPSGSGLSKAERKRMQAAVASSKSIQEVAEKLEIDLSEGQRIMDEIVRALNPANKVDSTVQEISAKADQHVALM